MALPQQCMSVLFDEISADLGLSVVEVGWVWGILPLAGLFSVFISGMLVDRFGAKPVLVIVCLLSGITGALRGMSDSFATLMITSFLFGLIANGIPANTIKTAATWFPPRQLGLASGVMTAGMGVGLTAGSMFSATVVSPALGGWDNVLYLYGGISVIFSLLWLFTAREPQQSSSNVISATANFRGSMTEVLTNKSVWMIGLGMLGFTGCIQGFTGYLPLYLRDAQGWLPASADGSLSLYAAVSTLGAIPITMISDRMGNRKIFLLAVTAISIVGVALLSVADGVMIWIIMVVTGLGRDGLMALSSTATIESEGIGPKYAATANGLVQTLIRIGSSIAPPLGNSLAARGAGLPFLVWSCFAVIGLGFFSAVRKNRRRQA